jgi:hypothetical protein
MADPKPAPISPEQLRQQRMRSRNLALFWSLLAFCALLFAITIVQLSKDSHLLSHVDHL